MKLYTNFNMFLENTRTTDISSEDMDRIREMLVKVSRNDGIDAYDITEELGNPYDNVVYDQTGVESDCSINIGFTTDAQSESYDDNLLIKFDYEYRIHKGSGDDEDSFSVEDVRIKEATYNGKSVMSINNFFMDFIERLISAKF